MNDRPIGVFDSGIGGITVVKEIIKTLPHEDIIYLGDTARVPYGTRGKETITRFAKELATFLLTKKVKALVIACNTISATCYEEIVTMSPVPVMGVIKPTVSYALKKTKRKTIGVIGTRATITSRIYEKEIKNRGNSIRVITQACPMFVPLAEEGLLQHKATKAVAQDYLNPFKKTPIDTLILGCTHYPLLQKTIEEVVGKNITLVDSAKPTALALKNILSDHSLLQNKRKSKHQFYFTDDPDRAKMVASLFFGAPLPGRVEKVTCL